jgi:hypothetical protein
MGAGGKAGSSEDIGPVKGLGALEAAGMWSTI